VPEEGKTTTAANLAITLAQAGVRVCLVEADLRRPRLGGYLGLETAAGVTSVLIGKARLSDVIQHWGDQGIDVLASGPVPPNPSELLSTHAMADLLHELEERYALVIIDAPPLLPVTDAAVLANLASGAILVIRHGKTKREQVRRAIEAFRAVDTHLYGIVFNMVPSRGPDAYYYGYAYRYDSKAAELPKDIDAGNGRATQASVSVDESAERLAADRVGAADGSPSETQTYTRAPTAEG
jgi:capsular exopolysaccharide synthesis family protein